MTIAGWTGQLCPPRGRSDARSTPFQLDAADEKAAAQLAEAGRLLRGGIEALELGLDKRVRERDARVDDGADLCESAAAYEAA